MSKDDDRLGWLISTLDDARCLLAPAPAGGGCFIAVCVSSVRTTNRALMHFGAAHPTLGHDRAHVSVLLMLRGIVRG